MQSVFTGPTNCACGRISHEDIRKMLFGKASLALEIIALEIANRGWKHNLRIGLDSFFFIFSPN